ncbi:protein of unknown function [Lentzea waywayandensis]|uniref:DUF1996 domain-containing protein n=1 Tax=Lentzea waywayandensis TaxID=84724 RepID=A0A1I6FJF4_9PSEU|nr:DUF1996 domain-containing protein [Lentzea waywayandensis]SFR30069.1 protein of unknown function [Lentzea waywayandensis]
MVLAALITGTFGTMLVEAQDDGYYVPATTLEPTQQTVNVPSVVVRCGTNERRHLNPDNPVAAPGVRAAAHHMHEYVGNTSTDAMSTDATLSASTTTCERGDLSSYSWPALRLTDGAAHDMHAEGGGADGNLAGVLPPDSVEVRYEGSPAGQVVPMPRFLRMMTGDAKAVTNGFGADTRARWGCSDTAGRFTTKYPLCDDGDQTLRVYEFPSCWDGANVDSASHRSHVVFPLGNGVCPVRTFAIPRLVVAVGYKIPHGRPFVIDTFPSELRHPATDHAGFINVMPEAQMSGIATRLNERQ